ncbi:MAG: hypothetical protein ABIN89_19730 [Chitinophagaceae bacterium]
MEIRSWQTQPIRFKERGADPKHTNLIGLRGVTYAALIIEYSKKFVQVITPLGLLKKIPAHLLMNRFDVSGFFIVNIVMMCN